MRSSRNRRSRKRISRLSGLSVNRMVPNVLTLLALCAGMTAMRFAMGGNFEMAVFAIIAAGIFDTDLAQTLPERLLQMHDFWVSAGRLGRPAELAEYAAFMVSDRNSFMNAEVVIVDGGAIT